MRRPRVSHVTHLSPSPVVDAPSGRGPGPLGRPPPRDSARLHVLSLQLRLWDEVARLSFRALFCACFGLKMGKLDTRILKSDNRTRCSSNGRTDNRPKIWIQCEEYEKRSAGMNKGVAEYGAWYSLVYINLHSHGIYSNFNFSPLFH